jgi:hypothetical protein
LLNAADNDYNFSVFATQATLRITAISRPLTTAGTQATAGMKATTVKQATAVTPPKQH